MSNALMLQDLFFFLPETCLLVTGVILLLLDPFLPKEKKSFLGGISVMGILASALATLCLWKENAPLFGHLYRLDPYALFFKLIFLGTTLFTFLVSFRYLSLTRLPQGEYFALILFATTGMMVMAAGMDLLSIYLGLEVMAISSYALVGFLKKERASLEGALKYFLLGAFNSGIILYGIALLYGTWGTTHLSEILNGLSRGEATSKMFLVGVAMLIAGFAFKIAAFPFHMWAPDVYEGSPPPVAGFISVGSKAASFAALLRLFLFAFKPLFAEWQGFFVFLAMMTMTVGNLLAISQVDLKRMLAYSSIAHAGYLLIGLAVGTPFGISGMLFYFVAYALMNLGAFAMIVLLAQENFRAESIEDFKGLAKAHPVWALCFLIFLLSLAGIPPSAGFIGKFYLFAGAVQSGLYGLALVAVLNSVVALSYYFRIVRNMYMMEERSSLAPSRSWTLRLSLILLAFFTLLAGLYPVPLLETVRQAGALFL
ncbi:MAG: NADH-quinone oxidoreductase subunit N [Candidatus Omnitrophica bacterium]|nr:NADH-quinone oxidoreductase subunit N [Candidatus Omnitrophota bacterium]